MNVVARLGLARLGIGTEHRFEFFEQIGRGPEMAEMIIAALLFLVHDATHLVAVEAVKRIALDEGGADLLAPEDVLERPPHGGRTGAGRTCHRDDGVFCRHRVPSEPHQTAAAEKRRMFRRKLRIGMIARDQTHDLIRAEDERCTRVSVGRLNVENATGASVAVPPAFSMIRLIGFAS